MRPNKARKSLGTSPEFVEEAKKNLILVFIDSPRDKALLSDTAKKRNPELVRKYKISGFPTVMFIDSKGEGIEASRPSKGVSPADYAPFFTRSAGSL